jgi:protein-S-isoprenylcysteine O-methyltransferase Ste14
MATATINQDAARHGSLLEVGRKALVGIGSAAVRFEERDLISTLGDDYRAYRARVPMILPLGTKAEIPKTPKYT